MVLQLYPGSNDVTFSTRTSASTFKYLSATPRPKPSTAPSTSIIITATITIFILPSLDYELDCLYRHNPYPSQSAFKSSHPSGLGVFLFIKYKTI